MTDQPTDGPTNQPTNQLTWVGARDTCVSKNHWNVAIGIVYANNTTIGEKQNLPMLRLVERTQDSIDILCSRHPEIVGWIR